MSFFLETGFNFLEVVHGRSLNIIRRNVLFATWGSGQFEPAFYRPTTNIQVKDAALVASETAHLARLFLMLRTANL